MPSYREHRTWSSVDHSLGSAAEKNVGKTGATVGAHGNQICGHVLGLLDDHLGRITLNDQGSDLGSCLAQRQSGLFQSPFDLLRHRSTLLQT